MRKTDSTFFFRTCRGKLTGREEEKKKRERERERERERGRERGCVHHGSQILVSYLLVPFQVQRASPILTTSQGFKTPYCGLLWSIRGYTELRSVLTFYLLVTVTVTVTGYTDSLGCTEYKQDIAPLRKGTYIQRLLRTPYAPRNASDASERFRYCVETN